MFLPEGVVFPMPIPFWPVFKPCYWSSIIICPIPFREAFWQITNTSRNFSKGESVGPFVAPCIPSACLMWSSPTWCLHVNHRQAFSCCWSKWVASPWWQPVLDAVVSHQVPMITSLGISHCCKVVITVSTMVWPVLSGMHANGIHRATKGPTGMGQMTILDQ